MDHRCRVLCKSVTWTFARLQYIAKWACHRCSPVTRAELSVPHLTKCFISSVATGAWPRGVEWLRTTLLSFSNV